VGRNKIRCETHGVRPYYDSRYDVICTVITRVFLNHAHSFESPLYKTQGAVLYSFNQGGANMRSTDATQFSITIGTKNRLDKFKAEYKEEILEKYALKKRMITNDKAIECLLDICEGNQILMKKEPWRTGNVSKGKK